MGQKVNPVGLRIGLSQKWRSRCYAEGKRFAKYMEEDKMYARNDEANADDFLENYSN